MPRTLLIFPIVILFIFAGYVGVLLYAKFTASSSHVEKIIPGEKVWQERIEGLQQAIKLDPTNPEYLEKEAMLYRYKAFSLQPESEQSHEANREALVRFQHLLTLRPSWAPYWGNIISIKYDLWEYDEVMMAALQIAARMAPWSKTNQHIILRAGFHGWPFLDDETREVINLTMKRALQLQPEPTMRLALNQGFIGRVSPYAEGDEELKEMYGRYIASMKKRLLKD